MFYLWKLFSRDKICLVSITRRDDTLIDASSISEEDIIEICIMKGHTHPIGCAPLFHYGIGSSLMFNG